jgi:Cellulase (glycosyl hydrolase family 5)
VNRRLPFAAAALAVLCAVVPAACGSGDGGGSGNDGAAQPRLEFALQDDAVLLFRSHYDRDKALSQIRRLGVTRIKTNVDWAVASGGSAKSKSPPDRVQYDFAAQDSLIDAAGAAGIRVQLALTGPAPAWASAAGKIGPDRPDPKLYGEFVAAAARHFRGRVDRYSIWNEPNYVGWLSPEKEAPAMYRELYQAGYAAIKQVDAKAQVLIGETAPYRQPGRATAPLAFLRQLACVDESYRKTGDCPPLKADGYAHHPYDFANPPTRPYPGADNVTVGSLDRLTRALDRLAAADALTDGDGEGLDLYLTEFGYFASGPLAFPEQRRARYLRQAIDIVSRNPRVREMLQYLLVAPPPDAPGGRFNTSIVAPDGTEQATYAALQQWAREGRRKGLVAGPADGALKLPSPGG